MEEKIITRMDFPALLTITIPIVSNWQTDGNSSLPNLWFRA
jgi:hypothetical protein